MKDLVKLVKAMSGLRILVAGDLMLDAFVYGDVERISPESPVPVLNIRSEDMMLGGAGNVLSNLCALGAKPSIFALVGEDADGELAIDIAKKMGADISGILKDSSRPTTRKTRYLARHQQLLRTDFEKTHPLSADLESALLTAVEKPIKGAGAVVLSDYGKGVLTPAMLQKIIAVAKRAGIPVLVDPKGRDYAIYAGADIVTPNRKELAEATGAAGLKGDSEIVAAASRVIDLCDIACVIATRSEDGMSVICQGKEPLHLKTRAREVFDVSGAGDTVIATIAAAIAAGADIETAAVLSNIAGGIAVSKVGTSPVRTEEMLHAIEGNFEGPHTAPFCTAEQALEQIKRWRAQGLKVGLTNGCFDILHAGHVRYLNEARGRCDKLIVAINRDESVKLLKGPSRPVNSEEARASVLGALGCVDMVISFGASRAGEDNTPSALVAMLQPDIFFKGGDYTEEQLPESKIVRAYGGEVAIMGMLEGFSTTAILAKSRAGH